MSIMGTLTGDRVEVRDVEDRPAGAGRLDVEDLYRFAYNLSEI